MIAAGLDWEYDSRFDLPRIVSALGAQSRDRVASEIADDRVLCAMHDEAHAPYPWRAARTRDDRPVLLAGWLDNGADVARELGLPPESRPAAIYAAAFDAWGDRADRRLVGDFATIVVLGPGVLRLSRGAWSVRPLFWATLGSVVVAASIPRPLFAAGFPKTPDPDRYAEALYALATVEGDNHFFADVFRVPPGAIVTIDHGRAQTDRWYDPLALGPVRLKRDADYVAAARDLMNDAAAAAVAPANKPGVLLSGGLDSAIVASAMLRHLGPDRRLPSFTFEPNAEDGIAADAGHFTSERPAVEAFAAMHPTLAPHFVANHGHNLDYGLDDIFRAADAAYPALAVNQNQGPWQAAADMGCDWVYNGEWGNQTFSSDGRWGFVEFLRRGKWLELWKMLRDHPGDDRSMARRLVARSILPNLPATVRGAMRTLVHGEPKPSLLRGDVVARLDLDARRAAQFGNREWVTSRSHHNHLFWRQATSAGEMTHAIEQLYGFRLRAVPLHQPLVEFCLAIPTEQFVRGGETRWLARRMAQGVMPEAQRTERRYGLHGADWHRRYTPQVPQMREELERIADDPVMSRIIDTDRALDLLNEWPDRPTHRGLVDVYVPIAAAIVAGRFSRYVDGRN